MSYPKQSDYEYNAKDLIRDLCNEYDDYITELEGRYLDEIELLKVQIEELENK